ncbi:MAG: hypothetical protein ACI4J0_12075 [Huintestinicola sp.]|uniref:hypothetical protein n=1 Tax=Huintestinicola sp. TaxID=2981661 RepID=UPI003F0A978A
MSKTESGAKKAGKALTAFVILILIAVLAVSKFIGGQDTAALKYCSAVASANFKEYAKTVSPGDIYASGSESDFKAACTSGLRGLPEFSELEETDNLSANVKITEHKMNGSLTEWICTADIDFFCSGSSVSYNGVTIAMRFSGGKWLIQDAEPNLF